MTMKYSRPFCTITVLTSFLAAPVAFAQGGNVAGKWQQQRFSNLPGSSLADLTESPAFYSAPTTTSLVNSSYTSLGDNYGARTRGYITPATSGIYTFWVSGDDETRLSLSSDSQKWSAQTIASFSSWTTLNSFDEGSSQRSVSLYLQAGQSYYVELLHKEGGGADHASVTWAMQPASSATETNWAATANGAVASQTSTYPGSFSAANAIDGNLSTFSHTNNSTSSSITADFRQDRLISRIELVNRQNGWQNRLSNFRVTVEDSAGSAVAQKDFYPTSGSAGSSESWTLPATVAARRVKVQLLGLNRDNNYYLTLAELRAFGPSTQLRNWSREAGAVATQSSSYSSSYPASLAIDGNPATIQHTADSAGSFLLSDLGSDRLIDVVEIFNRPDAATLNRLSNFRISILDAANTVLASQDYFTASGNVKAALRWQLPTAVTGRKVKVELLGLNRAGNSFLHIAELNVWGRENISIAERGLRSPIPAAVMSSYDATITDDQDDDFMPDATELAAGLDPADPTDALADNDQDGINNVTELRANANPSLRDSVPGILVDEIWNNLPSDNLTAASYKAALLRNPTYIDTITTTQAFAHGEQYARRVRGYITAPVTGTYQFWGAADSDVDLFLSTTTSKIDRVLILDNKVLSWGQNYDIDPSQKSTLVTLTAGQKYYFEFWHKEGIGGSSVAVAWKIPNGPRSLIPAAYLSSYPGEANDQDDDYLKDDYELANGLSITDNGKTSGSTDGAYGDLDGDGLSNLEEQKNNTAANLVDSDGDGVSDYDEVNFFGSATLANDIGAFTPVVTMAGDAYTASFGEWDNFAGKARQNCRRGSVTYPVTVPASGIHALKFTISSIIDGAKNEQHDFHLKLNGKHLAYKTITILPDGTSTLAVLTPWLQAGQTYNLELFVDNSYNWRRVSINQLQVLAAGGTDSNENNIPDWTEIRVNDLNGLDTVGTIHSKTSPAVLEGKAQHLGLVTTNAPALIAAPNGRFFTEVPLAAASATELSFTFENNALQQNAAVHWLPTNLKTETSITIREGDSLLLTAFDDAEHASLESYSYSVSGATMNNTSDQPTVQLFATPGNYNINTTHTAADGTTSTTATTINVLAKVTIDPPVCIVGYPRTWTPPALPSGATLILDSEIETSSGGTANSYTIATSTPLNQALVVRSSTGQILGASEVKSASVRSSDQTGPLAVENYLTYQIVEMAVVVYGDIGNAEIQCQIIIGGVTYTDGNTVRNLTATSFNSWNEHILIYNKPRVAHSNCHKFNVRQQFLNITQFN